MIHDYNSIDYAEKIGLFDDQEQKAKKKAKLAQPTAKLRKRPRASNEGIFDRLTEAIMEAKLNGKFVNPFLVGFQFDIKKANGDLIETEKIYNEDGEELETRHNCVRYIDRAKFVKIYPSLLSPLFKGLYCIINNVNRRFAFSPAKSTVYSR